MLTNFVTIRKAVRKMASIDKMNEDGTMATLSKRERLQITRQRQKLEKNLGSIADLTRLPSAIFVVDILNEHIAIAEAKKLGIPTFAIVDTNSNPTLVDFAIPANDDATKSIDKIMEIVTNEIAKGLAERKSDKDKAKAERETKKEEKKPAAKEVAKEETKPEAKEEAKAESK
jgi:small subunit ribosomal protein S2